MNHHRAHCDCRQLHLTATRLNTDTLPTVQPSQRGTPRMELLTDSSIVCDHALDSVSTAPTDDERDRTLAERQ